MSASIRREAVLDAIRITLIATILGFAYNALSPNGIPLLRTARHIEQAADSSIQQSSTAAQPLAIDVSQAADIFREGKAIFIDARHKDEFIQGHIPNAICIPFKELEKNPQLIANISKDALIVSYCGGIECELSKDLGFKMAEMGYSKVRIFFGGFREWTQNNMPSEAGPPKQSGTPR